MKLHRRYSEVYGPYQVMVNEDGISIYINTYVTTDNDQTGQIYLSREELNVCRNGHDTMMEQNAAHISYEADVTAHLLDTDGKKIGVTRFLDTGAVVCVIPIKNKVKDGFPHEGPDTHEPWIRSSQSRSHIYVAGRTPVKVLDELYVVKNLDNLIQFILGLDFFRNFDVMTDLNNRLIRIRNPNSWATSR